MSAFAYSDRRLVNGPEISVPPIDIGVNNNVKSLLVEKKRIDGRQFSQPRPIFIKTGIVKKAAGSAYLEQGNIKISCTIDGPRQIKKAGVLVSSTVGNFECEFKFASFSTSWRKVNHKDTEERDISSIITQAIGPSICLHMFPKSLITANVTVVESDGRMATIAAAIKCISVALSDASINMYDLTTCISASLIDDQWVIDCNQLEENEESVSLLISSMPSAQEITHIIQTGKTNSDQTQQGINN
ncbi:Exosome complex component MTR3 [Smittium culicis]|uniref:Exosome complex component MTR3 n=1 Tax=Smittium culicis TaxID=133412 RepID=A0A1R1XZW8_9FUNG|nr:Exosome complex component MTR3 [Smittium culicis]